MGREEIVARIISDAEAEAAEIVRAAKERAEEIVTAAEKLAGKDRAETLSEVAERTKRISEGKAATARLDSAKIQLSEKRRVIDEIYNRAFERLMALNERDTIKLLEWLLSEYAEQGDEIVLAKNFPDMIGATELPVVKERGLHFSSGRADIDGGCILHGKLSDKNLSYSALLNADKEEFQAELASKLFV